MGLIGTVRQWWAISASLSFVLLACRAGDDPKHWQGATPITDATGISVRLPQLAVDNAGNAIAVWSQSFDSTRSDVWASRYVPGNGWDAGGIIDNDIVNSDLDPHVAISENGIAVAAWIQFERSTGHAEVWSNRFVTDAGWGVAELIQTDSSGAAATPQVSVNANGDALAVWIQSDGTRYSIWANRYQAGLGWGMAELLETENTGDAFLPQVAMDRDGNAIAVWAQYDGSRFNIWANHYLSGIGWGVAELIEHDDDGAFYPQVALDGDGNAMAVWVQSDGTWANRYISGAGWGAAELIGAADSVNATLPEISMAHNGIGVAVWSQSDGSRFDIWSSRFVPGSGWESAQVISRINSDQLYDAFFSQVAVDDQGNAVAVWQQFDGVHDNIWSNRTFPKVGLTRASGAETLHYWGDAEMISINNGGISAAPQIGIDSDGDAIAVWEQINDPTFNIWSNRYSE